MESYDADAEAEGVGGRGVAGEGPAVTHLWSDRAKTQTVCGLPLVALGGEGGDFASSHTTDCPGCIPPVPPDPSPRAARITFLEKSRPLLIEYLKQKLEAEDWHGVQDAASDLRDLDCELDGLRY